MQIFLLAALLIIFTGCDKIITDALERTVIMIRTLVDIGYKKSTSAANKIVKLTLLIPVTI